MGYDYSLNGNVLQDNTSASLTSGLGGALFTPVQQRVLGLLFGQPDRRFQSAELIRLAGSGTGAAHRRGTRLAEAGLVTVERIGNQKHYQANREGPIFEELHGLIVKTFGLVAPLRAALGPLVTAFVPPSSTARSQKGTTGRRATSTSW